MARSVAFWFDKVDKKTPPKVELHINFWSLESKRSLNPLPYICKTRKQTNAINYLDIGVKLNAPETKEGSEGSEDSKDSKEQMGYKAINIYLPFTVNEKNYYSTLGETICKCDDLISVIFNTTFESTKSDKNNKIHEITFPKKKLKFYTHIRERYTESDDGVKIIKTEYDIGTTKQKGTTLSFPSELFNEKKSDSDNVDKYFRFRIILDETSKSILKQTYKPQGSVITNYFESTEIIDFRINESRNLPDQIKRKLNSDLKLDTVHLFLIQNANSEFKMSHSKYKRCRLLEEGIWDNYLSLGKKKISAPSQMLIYHWEQRSKNTESKVEEVEYIDHFSAFAKFTKRKVGWGRVLSIVIFVFITGVLSSMTASYACNNYSFINSRLCTDNVSIEPKSDIIATNSAEQKTIEKPLPLKENESSHD